MNPGGPGVTSSGYTNPGVVARKSRQSLRIRITNRVSTVGPTSTGKHANKGSPLIRMANTIDINMERSSPFHTQNAPHSYRLSSHPFTGRFFINKEACKPDNRKSLVANQRMWLLSAQGRRTLNVFTDGSKTDRAAGWAVRGIHAGRVMFQFNVPFARRCRT